MGGGKASFSPFGVGKTLGPLGQSVSSNGVTDYCSKMSNLVQSTPVIDLIVDTLGTISMCPKYQASVILGV